jgi:1-deoxy-D-xylulose-5-phosphate synthase
MGSAVVEFVNKYKYSTNVVILGVGDYFVSHGKPEELYRECGFDSEGIIKTINSILNSGKI